MRVLPHVCSTYAARNVRVRFHKIRNARISSVGKYQSCMFSKLPIICKQTLLYHSWLPTAGDVNSNLKLMVVEDGAQLADSPGCGQRTFRALKSRIRHSLG